MGGGPSLGDLGGGARGGKDGLCAPAHSEAPQPYPNSHDAMSAKPANQLGRWGWVHHESQAIVLNAELRMRLVFQ